MSDDHLQPIVETLIELNDDDTIPRNVKAKLTEIAKALGDAAEESSVKINKALNDLDEISNDTNLQPFTRTQLWNISSMLESL